MNKLYIVFTSNLFYAVIVTLNLVMLISVIVFYYNSETKNEVSNILLTEDEKFFLVKKIIEYNINTSRLDTAKVIEIQYLTLFPERYKRSFDGYKAFFTNGFYTGFGKNNIRLIDIHYVNDEVYAFRYDIGGRNSSFFYKGELLFTKKDTLTIIGNIVGM